MSKQVKDFPQVSSVSATDKYYTTVGTADKGYHAEASQIKTFIQGAESYTYAALTTLVGSSGLSVGVWYFIPAPTDVYAGGTTYALDDEVTDGSGTYYKSLQNSNTGNALTDTAWWKPVLRDIFMMGISTTLLSQQAEIIKNSVSKSVYYDFTNDNELYFTYVDTTQVGTTAVTSEETLASMTLWANTLGIDNDFIEIRASGSFAANANFKTIRVKFESTFGANNFDPSIGVNGNSWNLEGRIFRTGAANQTTSGNMVFSPTTTGTPSLTEINTTLTEDLTTSLTLSITGQNGTASANDIVLDTFSVGHIKSGL